MNGPKKSQPTHQTVCALNNLVTLVQSRRQSMLGLTVGCLPSPMSRAKYVLATVIFTCAGKEMFWDQFWFSVRLPLLTSNLLHTAVITRHGSFRTFWLWLNWTLSGLNNGHHLDCYSLTHSSLYSYFKPWNESDWREGERNFQFERAVYDQRVTNASEATVWWGRTLHPPIAVQYRVEIPQRRLCRKNMWRIIRGQEPIVGGVLVFTLFDKISQIFIGKLHTLEYKTNLFLAYLNHSKYSFSL